MNLKKSFAVLLFLVSVGGMLFAQEKVELSVKDAVEYAIDSNLSLKQSKISLDAARRDKNTSWNSISPSLNLSASLRGPNPNPVPNGDDYNLITVMGSASFALTPAVATNIRSAVLAYEQAQITWEQAVNKIDLNVREAYYNIIYLQKYVELQKKSAESSRAQYQSNLAKYNRGTLSNLDVLSAQVTAQNAHIAAESAEITLENAVVSFKQLLGMPLEKEIEFTDSMDFIEKIQSISIDGIEAQSASVKSLELQVEQAKTALLATRFAAWGPALTASLSYNMQATTLDYDFSSKYPNGFSFSAGVSIPLDGFLPWSKGAQSIAARKDSVKNLNIQLENSKVTLDVTVKNYMNRIKQSFDNISLRKSSVELARQTYAMTQEAYNHGTRDFLSLQTAMNNLYTAEISLMSEEYNLICAIFELENTLGVPYGTLWE